MVKTPQFSLAMCRICALRTFHLTYLNGESEGDVHNELCKYLTKAVPSKDNQASPRRQYQRVPLRISDQADYPVMEDIGTRKLTTGRLNHFKAPLPSPAPQKD